MALTDSARISSSGMRATRPGANLASMARSADGLALRSVQPSTTRPRIRCGALAAPWTMYPPKEWPTRTAVAAWAASMTAKQVMDRDVEAEGLPQGLRGAVSAQVPRDDAEAGVCQNVYLFVKGVVVEGCPVGQQDGRIARPARRPQVDSRAQSVQRRFETWHRLLLGSGGFTRYYSDYESIKRQEIISWSRTPAAESGSAAWTRSEDPRRRRRPRARAWL